jgi:ATP-binding cassette subfamily B protein
VRDIGIRRAVLGSTFFMILGLVSAVGTALVYGLGGYFVITGSFTIGTIVAFGSYLGQLYGALQGLAGAPVDFSPRWSASSGSSKCSTCRTTSSKRKTRGPCRQ